MYKRQASIARKLGVIVISHKRNMGKGEALKTGFKYFLKNTDVDIVVVADADGQYPIKYVKLLIEPLLKNEADFVSGYRNWSKVPFRHRLGNFVWKTTFNLLFGTNFKDTNCGLVGFTRKALKRVKRTGGGYIIENVLFIEALKNRFRIKQVPVEVRYKSISPVPRGVRVVLGVWLFILKEGIKFRSGL